MDNSTPEMKTGAGVARREHKSEKTQDGHQRIEAQRLLSTLTIPGFS